MREKKEKFTAWRKLRIGRRDRENRKKIIASARIADEKKKYKKRIRVPGKTMNARKNERGEEHRTREPGKANGRLDETETTGYKNKGHRRKGISQRANSGGYVARCIPKPGDLAT